MMSLPIIWPSQRRDLHKSLPTRPSKATWQVRRAPNIGLNSRVILMNDTISFEAVMGRSGFSARKREGDGATPLGSLTILGGFCRSSRWGLAKTVPWLKRLEEHTGNSLGWCDEPNHRLYNQACTLPISGSAETLFRQDRLYDCVLILDWNITSRARKRGSAIFLHIMNPDKKPTEGCIALAPDHLVRFLKQIKPGDRIKIIP